MAPLKELGPVQISTTDAGRLSALVLCPDESLQGPLRANHVEINIKAVGMNMVVSLECLPFSHKTMLTTYRNLVRSQAVTIPTTSAPSSQG